MILGEPQGIVREPGGPSMPGASIVKTAILENPSIFHNERRDRAQRTMP